MLQRLVMHAPADAAGNYSGQPIEIALELSSSAWSRAGDDRSADGRLADDRPMCAHRWLRCLVRILRCSLLRSRVLR